MSGNAWVFDYALVFGYSEMYFGPVNKSGKDSVNENIKMEKDNKMTVAKIDLNTLSLDELDNLVKSANSVLKDRKEKDGNKLIQDKLSVAYAAIREAEEIAEKYGLEFDFSLEYGMGGTYYPTNKADNEWNSSYEGWVSSSEQC